MTLSKTIFCDIDGVLVNHSGDVTEAFDAKVLPGVVETVREWDKKGYRIILVSGRRESMRAGTEEQLIGMGIIFDQLILGIGGGNRILINDMKLNKTDPTCFAYNLVRNEGLSSLEMIEL
jgi:phosphoglycolate phosphatase-like HAD superfamily hydrolase